MAHGARTGRTRSQVVRTRITVRMSVRLAAVMAVVASACLGVAQASAAADSASPAPGRAGQGALTWTRLPGMVEAFAGSRVSMIERGEDGFLAVGRSIASGLPRVWRSTDGLAWERIVVPPTTFGGAEPSSLAWGPNGWVALGWDVSLQRVAQQVWLSADGVAWEPSSDPSGRLRSKAPEYPGPPDVFRLPWRELDVVDGAMVISEIGAVPYRVSHDGRTWRPVKRSPSPVVAVPPELGEGE